MRRESTDRGQTVPEKGRPGSLHFGVTESTPPLLLALLFLFAALYPLQARQPSDCTTALGPFTGGMLDKPEPFLLWTLTLWLTERAGERERVRLAFGGGERKGGRGGMVIRKPKRPDKGWNKPYYRSRRSLSAFQPL